MSIVLLRNGVKLPQLCFLLMERYDKMDLNHGGPSLPGGALFGGLPLEIGCVPQKGSRPEKGH